MVASRAWGRRSFFKSCAAAALAPLTHPLLAHGAASAPYAPPPGNPVFLLESSAVEDYWGVRRELQPLVRARRDPLIVLDRPWEGLGPFLGGSVLYDPDDRLFRCWYSVFDTEAYKAKRRGSYQICFATSPDGIAWTKPELGLVDYRGNKRNNLIRLGRKYVEMMDIVPAPKESRLGRRYVGLYLDGHGLCLAYSDDGCDWTEHAGNPIEPSHSDCHNSLVYDSARERWLVHLRAPLRASKSNRRIALMESKDLRTWSRPEVVFVPDEDDPPEFYSLPVFQRGNLFFGLVQLFDKEQKHIEIELVLSSDGRNWLRVPPRRRFLERGPAGAFDSGMVGTADDCVVVGDEMRFYYSGWNGEHSSFKRTAAIGYATVERDRLFGLVSNTAAGAVLSRPMRLTGRRLEVNAVARGALRAALLDLAGKEVPGYGIADCAPVHGDKLRHRIDWKAAGLPPSPVRVRFTLDDATLYAFSTHE